MSAEYLKRQDVLGLALDLHGYVTGSAPDLPREHRDMAIRFLRRRLDNWSVSTTHSELFDEAVRTLLTVAVHEAEEHRSRRG